ncbi:MAG: hypothetical protein AAGD25_00405 [Cyanobacteria bacterium P01_F01_bin.150]
MGWYLAAIHAQFLIWLSLASLIIYLINTQQGGLVLAHGWVAVVMSISAVTRIWPSVWPSHIPYHYPQLWALILLIIWAIAATLIHLLASFPHMTQQEFAQHPVALRLALRHRSPALRLSITSARTSNLFFVILMAWVSSAIALGAMAYIIGVRT